MRRFGNYVESVSKNKLYKLGYQVFISYWSEFISQQNIFTKLNLPKDYLYTQKRDKNGLYKVIVYAKVA